MKKTFWTVAFLFAATWACAQSKPQSQTQPRARPTAEQQLGRKYSLMPPRTVADGSYGPDNRNVFDLWLVESDKPTPLAIFVHGGGFRAGGKDKLSPDELKTLLDAGISVASISYRYAAFPGDGVLVCMQDGARALQYLRSRAPEWNIDKQRVGMWGGSAGAGITAWIAFHDDLADPKSADPVCRESTRIQAALLNGVQTTYDVFTWPAFFGLPEDSPMIARFNDSMLSWLGVSSIEEKDTPECMEKRKQLDLLGLLTADDPPFLASANQDGRMPPVNSGAMIHHPLFGKAFVDKGRNLGVECYALLPTLGIDDGQTLGSFFKKELFD